jgi:hypothetical protein
LDVADERLDPLRWPGVPREVVPAWVRLIRHAVIMPAAAAGS